MKSIHWLILTCVIWGSSTIAAVLLKEPGIYVAATVSTISILVALSTSDKISVD